MTDKLAVSRIVSALQGKRIQLLQYQTWSSGAPCATATVGSASSHMAQRLLVRFNREGLPLLEDQSRLGRHPTITPEQGARVCSWPKTPG